jgi:hypothetical protein
MGHCPNGRAQLTKAHRNAPPREVQQLTLGRRKDFFLYMMMTRRSQGSSVKLETRLRGSIPSREKGNSSPHYRIQTGSVVHPASFPKIPGTLTAGLSGRGVNLTTQFHTMSRLRMNVAMPPLPPYVLMIWCLFKHNDNL